MANTRRQFTILAITVVLIAGLATAILWRVPLAPSGPIETDCLERLLAPHITADDASQIMAMSYESPENWSFSLHHMAAFCRASGNWWFWDGVIPPGPEGRRLWWWPLSPDEVPQAVKAYAADASSDLVFYVIYASFCCGIPFLDAGWVDGVSSRLVEKVRIAS